MPCPTSARGRAKDAVPSSLMVTVTRLAVGRRGVGEEVVEVVELGRLRDAWGLAAVAWGATSRSAAGDERGAADDVPQEAASPDGERCFWH